MRAFFMSAALPAIPAAYALPSAETDTLLVDALTGWAEKRNVTLVVPAGLVDGLRLKPGTPPPQDDLASFLAPFGLEAEQTLQGAIIIKRMASKPARTSPPPKRRQGSLRTVSEPSAPDSDIILGAVLVTTQNRPQLFADVPVSVTAVSGSRTRRENLTDLERVSERVPGFFAQRQTDGSPSFVIRGIEAAPAGTLGEPSVSITIDGFEANRQHGSNTELLDIERIEVVRGPQGVLFGRGAQIGAVAIHTNRADLEDKYANVELIAGTDRLLSISAVANQNSADGKSALRLALRRREQAGLRHNLLTPDMHVNDDDLQAARISAAWRPSDQLRFDVVYEHQYDRDRAVSTKAIGIASPGGDLDPNSDAVQNPETLRPRRRIQRAQIMTEWNISPDLTFHGMTGLRETRLQNSFDPDGTSYPFLFSEAIVAQTAYQHDARLSYDAGGKWRAVWGGSVFFDDTFNHNSITVNEQLLAAGFPSATTPLPGRVRNGQWEALSEGTISDMFVGGQRRGYSLHTNFSLDITRRLTLDAGLRASYDENEVTTRISVYSIDGIPPVLMEHGLFGSTYGETAVLTDAASMISPRLAVTYKLTDRLNLYTGFSEGVRAGFPQAQIKNFDDGTYAVTDARITPEKASNLEAGLKGDLSDTVKVDLALFWYQLRDFQTLQPPPALTLTNGGKATGRGLEFSVSYEPFPGLDLYTSYAWLDTEYDEFITTTPDGVVHDLKGNSFRFAPEHTVNAAIDWTLPLNDRLSAFTSVNYSWRSRYFFNNDNLPQERQSAFGLLDLRAGILSPRKGWRAEVFANNALDQDWVRDIGNTGKYFGISTAIPADPRIIGIRLSFETG